MISFRRLAAVLLPLFVAAAAWGQVRKEEFENLKVLPKDIPPGELRAMMNGFTRSLGVRCIFCHVGEEGKPFRHEDFPKDDKATKLKAREMIKMTMDLNEKYLAGLKDREDPPIRITCFTCHHGATEPRTLQDVLQASYEHGGVDTMLTRYQSLRDRYYGRAVYDFGEAPLADVAGKVREKGQTGDALRLLALNVEMNPKSQFAKRQHASSAIGMGFATSADSGRAAYARFKTLYGGNLVGEGMLNDVGYQFMGAGKNTTAVAVMELNVAENPKSGNAWDSMGEAYATVGDKQKAIAAYAKAVELDPANDNAKTKLAELKAPAKKSKK